jgi:chemotaxis receptor (MCP) glutamine deamidase CheD
MELLINGILKIGAARHRLEAKLFGGARTMNVLGDGLAAYSRRRGRGIEP